MNMFESVGIDGTLHVFRTKVEMLKISVSNKVQVVITVLV